MANMKWTMRFLELAQMVASWSKDDSTRVGAVVVTPNNRIVSLGFNGPPCGTDDNAVTTRDVKLMRTLHAEENALLFARESVNECIMYVTHVPCAHCAAVIIQKGIGHVCWPHRPADSFSDRWRESHAQARKMFDEAGVIVEVVR